MLNVYGPFMANIKDVAGRAGVSTATVSHVVNNTRGVGSKTRARVLQAIRELGYAPNAAARSLVTGRSKLAGLLVSNICNPFFPDLAASFQEQALMHGVDTLLMNTSLDPHRALTCVRRLIELRVPGVAVMTSEINPAACESLSAAGICAVYLNVGCAGKYVSNISVDFEHGISAALDHLMGLGHRRIGFIGGSTALKSVARRKKAFISCAALNKNVETATADCDFSMRGGYMACAKMMTSFAPTALLTVNDVVAIGAMHCAFDRGIKVPQELSIIGFDDISFAEFAQPPLTTVRIPRAEIGALAYGALHRLLNAADHQGEQYHIAGRLMVRESTAPAWEGAATAGIGLGSPSSKSSTKVL